MGSTKPVLFLLFTCLQQSLTVCSQSTSSITLTEKAASLEKVLTDIHNLSGYTYLGEGDWPKLAHALTFTVKKMPLRQVLDLCFKDQPLTYVLNGSAIVISLRPP